MEEEQRRSVIQAVKALKNSEHQTTAIKVELEAHFNRGGGCDDCDGGRDSCGDCEGDGRFLCSYRENGDDCEHDEDDCNGEFQRCGNCDGEGYFDCDYCGGGEEWTDSECHDYMMNKLADIGLAERTDEPRPLSHHGVTHWKPVAPLVYGEFYRDGSVDSEFTFTLSVKNPKDILLLPKIMDIFKDLGEEIGNGMEVQNAGMHIALLNSSGGQYPVSRIRAYDATRFKNFRKSMIRLLPALYFLGSHDAVSRNLQFRAPQIERCDGNTGGQFRPRHPKYSAIAFRHGAVEFRVFETCYTNPLAIFDFIVVISKAMKFWTRAYTRNYLKPMPKPVKFGVDGGHDLKRFYFAPEHIDLLNAGLNILKPSYYTIKQLKLQRNFTVTKESINSKLKEVRTTAVKNYKEYEKRYSWELVYLEQDRMRAITERYAYGSSESERPEDISKALADAKKDAEKYARENINPKKTLDQHVEEEVKKALPYDGGQWTLDDGEPPAPTPREGNLVVDYEATFTTTTTGGIA